MDHTIPVLIGSTVLLVVVGVYAQRAMRSQNDLVEAAITASGALRRWEEARPHLHHASCPYACFLLETRIQALLYLKTSGAITDLSQLKRIEEELEVAYQLLDDHPPNLDPPSAGFYFRESLQ